MVRDITLRLHIWLLAALALPLIKWLPLRQVLRLLTPPHWFRPYQGSDGEAIRELVDHRLRNPRMMVHRPCLRRGLTLYHMLRLAGLPAELHFGIYTPRRVGERLQGHCWVTVEGQCAGDPPKPSLTAVWTHAR